VFGSELTNAANARGRLTNAAAYKEFIELWRVRRHSYLTSWQPTERADGGSATMSVRTGSECETTVHTQITDYLAAQPERKRADMQTLHSIDADVDARRPVVVPGL
jgi:hypothetical protein